MNDAAQPAARSRRYCRAPAAGYCLALLCGAGAASWIPAGYADQANATAVRCYYDRSIVTANGLVGPEDITVDTATGTAFVSADDRWGKDGAGAIFRYIPGHTAAPVRMHIVGGSEQTPDRFTSGFHPHGVSLFDGPCSDPTCAAGESVKRLFVINHRVDGGTKLSDVEVFDVVSHDTLRHVMSIGTDSAARHYDLNDLVAIDSRRFFATDNGRGTLSSSLLGQGAIVHHDGVNYRDVASDLKYPNGIAFHSGADKLYVSTSGGKVLRTYDVDETGDLREYQERRLSLGTVLDNIEWESPAREALLVAGHDSRWRFLLHALLKTRKSPSSVWRIPVAPDGFYAASENSAAKVYRHGEEILPGISVAASYGGRMLFGAVFVDRFLDCAYAGDTAG